MPSKPVSRRIALTEEMTFQPPASAQRDLARVRELLEQGIVENVKLQGFISKNKRRRYLEEGIDPAIYDGKPVNIDHPQVKNPDNLDEMRRAVGAPRPFLSRFGKIEEPYKIAGDGIYAKRLRFNTKHPLAEAFRGWVESMPDMIGFSPAQFGDVYETGDGGQVCERVTDVVAIELCADPATTRGLFETDMSSMDDEDGAGLLEDDEVLSDPADSVEPDADDPPAEVDAGGIDITPESFAQVTKIVQAFFDKQIDEAGAMAKIKQIFRTHCAITESVMPNLTDPKTGADAAKILTRLATRVKSRPVRKALELAVLENRQHRAKAAQEAKAQRATALMEAAGLAKEVAGDPAFIAELAECPSEQRMQTKIEFWRKLLGTRRDATPRSAPQIPLTEAERLEAERSLRTPVRPTVSDEDRNKRIDEFSKRYSGAA